MRNNCKDTENIKFSATELDKWLHCNGFQLTHVLMTSVDVHTFIPLNLLAVVSLFFFLFIIIQYCRRVTINTFLINNTSNMFKVFVSEHCTMALLRPSICVHLSKII